MFTGVDKLKMKNTSRQNSQKHLRRTILRTSLTPIVKQMKLSVIPKVTIESMSKRQTCSTFEDSPESSPEFGEPARNNNYIEESQQSFYDPTLTSTTTNLDQDETLPHLRGVGPS